MPSTMTFDRDVKRDATHIHAAMNGLTMQLAVSKGWLPDDVQAHADWLKKQPESYLQRVYRRVIKIERGEI
jgi:hypothetical protein